MKIELKHTIWKSYKDNKSLYTGVQRFSTWMSRVNRIAEKIEANPAKVKYYTCDKTEPKDIANKFRGDCFEGFCEMLLKLMENDKRIGIAKYEPCMSDDYGIDGRGVGLNGRLATVQIKFRSEYDKELHGVKDHLHNFVNASHEEGVTINENYNMLIITTGKGIFYRDMLAEWLSTVRYIAPNESWGCFKNEKYVPQDPTNMFSLQSLVDDNTPFWNNVFENIL